MANGYGGGGGLGNIGTPTPSYGDQVQGQNAATQGTPVNTSQAGVAVIPNTSMGPTGPNQTAVVTTENLVPAALVGEVQASIGPAQLTAEALQVSQEFFATYTGLFNPYEEDGDSIMGALLPNVYIKKVTLEDLSDDGGLIDREPHIYVEELVDSEGNVIREVTQPIVSSISDPFDNFAKHTRVSIDLVFKEKVENDDISLFTFEKIINSLRLKVVASAQQSMTNKIIPNQTYIPQEVGKYLYENIDNVTGPAIQGSELNFPLKAISQFNGLFSAAQSNSPNGFSQLEKSKKISQQFLLNLDKEVLSDGSIIYNIPFSCSLVVKHLSEKLQHLTLFAMTYIDYQALLDGQTEQEFAQSKKDQFAEIGYNEAGLEKGATHFKNLIQNYGYGLPARNEVIKNGKVNHTNKKYVYRENQPQFPNKANLVWNGPLHYHGPNNPSPDGYQGYMGGTPEHMTDPSMPTPKLKEVVAGAVGEIVDLRRQKQLEQLFFNYSDFGTGTTFNELVNPVLNTLDNQSVEGLYEKQTESNNWLKGKVESFTSKPVFSLHENGEGSFHFAIDVAKIIKYNTSFPGLVSIATTNQQSLELFNIIGNAKIQKLEIIRREVSEAKDDKGNHYDGDINQFPISLITSKDGNNNRLITKSQIDTKKSGFYGDSTLALDQKESAQIQQLPLLTEFFPNDPNNSFGFSDNIFGIRHYAVRDKMLDREKSENKVFQYGINIEIEDPFFNFLNQKLAIVKETSEQLDNYFGFCSQDSSYVSSYTNTFKPNFYEIWENSEFNTNPTGQNSFDNSQLFSQVKTFLEQVLFVLKPDPVLSADDKIDVFVLMTTLLNPLTGSPNGIQSVYNFVQLVEKNLNSLLEIASSAKSVKTTTYGLNAGEYQKISSTAKEPKNIIKISKMLKGVFDTNSDGSKGYEYIFDDKVDIQKEAGTSGFESISRSNMSKRIEFEANKYSIPESFENFDTNPSISRAAYLGPISVKTVKGKRFLENVKIAGQTSLNGVVTSYEVEDLNLINAVIDILESNKEETTYEPNSTKDILAIKNPDDNLIGDFKIKSSKDKVPNIMNILSQEGVSIEGGETNPIVVSNLEHPNFSLQSPSFNNDATVSPANIAGAISVVANPITDLNSSLENLTDYKMTLEGAYGPSSAKDVSHFLINLMLMRKAQYMPKLTVESLITQMYEYFFQGQAAAANSEILLRPNQIIKLFDQLLQLAPLNDLQNPAALEKAKSLFENYIKIADLIVNFTTIVKLEYFAGYAEKQGPNGLEYNLNSPVFKILDLNSYNTFVNELNTGARSVLIRMSPYEEATSFELDENLKMPIFNQYFLLRP